MQRTQSAPKEISHQPSRKKPKSPSIAIDKAQKNGPLEATMILEGNNKENDYLPNGIKLLAIKRNSMYSIPPPNYKYDPQRSFEKLV